MRLSGLFSILESYAQACAVCFGKVDQPGLISGLTWGLFVLLGFTFFLVSAITITIMRIEKNRANHEAKLRHP